MMTIRTTTIHSYHKHIVIVIKSYSYDIYNIIELKLKLHFFYLAKCVIGANNAIIPTYTAMQYPTVVRNFGVGMGNLAAGVALILVPYMWLLVR